MNRTINCRDAYLYICENLDADLNSPACRRIRKHLVACPDCSTYLDSVKRTVALYRALPTPLLPVQAHRRLVKTLKISRTRQGKVTPGRANP